MKKKFSKNTTIAIVMVFLSIIILTAIVYILFFLPINNFQKNTYLGQVDLSYLSIEEAEEKINNQIDKFKEQGIIFNYNQKEIKIPSKVVAFDSELSYEVFSINNQASLENVINNQSKNIFYKLFPQLKNQEIQIHKAQFRLHQERFVQTLNKHFADFSVDAKNAYFKFNDEEELIIVPEVVGINLKEDKNLDKAKKHLANLNLDKTDLAVENIYPQITASDLENKRDIALEVLEENNFILVFSEDEFPISNEELIQWLMINGEEVTLNKERVEDYLQYNIAPEINRLAKMPQFTIEDEKVKDWEPGSSGRKLLLEENAQNIVDNLLQEDEAISLEVEEIFYEEAEGLVSEIREIIGTGHSNFAGSPYNRVHNIKLGADTYDGIIINPGEEFSTLKHLGPVNASTGYLPELIIKEGETIPEYGGGLCQISTTLFRTALQAGLPITARQEHSYRVSYYEPAGTDASIYNPWPDFKFVNDTDYHILIQSRIEGSDIYFDFWSTDDGRIVKLTDPAIYNITPPPPTKYIESEDLEPGEEKCTERAINGASTHFDYVVTYPDGESVEERFNSHYVPWQEVCLIGEEIDDEDEDKDEDKNKEEETEL